MVATTTSSWMPKFLLRSLENIVNGMSFDPTAVFPDRSFNWRKFVEDFILCEMPDVVEVMNFYLEVLNPLAAKKIAIFKSKLVNVSLKLIADDK